jgi:hypothetical protein
MVKHKFLIHIPETESFLQHKKVKQNKKVCCTQKKNICFTLLIGIFFSGIGLFFNYYVYDKIVESMNTPNSTITSMSTLDSNTSILLPDSTTTPEPTTTRVSTTTTTPEPTTTRVSTPSDIYIYESNDIIRSR